MPKNAAEPIRKRPDPKKGRGARSNASGRFEAERREAFDDGWDHPEDDDLPPLRTTVMADSSRSIIARNDSPDVPFDRSINPYRGCEHGCVYCFARPTHTYLGFSAGLDFETKIVAKHRAAELLRKELAKPGYKPETLAMGTNTDPYQPVERKLKITRQVLEVLAETNHPVTIVTKSNLVLRDLDILAPMAAKGLARVCLSITTLDRKLARNLEPRASTPGKRLAAIRALSEAGVPAGVMTAPLIPALNDHELEAILEEARDAGAGAASYVLLRLPLEIAGLFEEWLEAHVPDRKERVLKLVRETRGGKTYDSSWGKRMKGEGVYARMLAERFAAACRKYGFNRASWPLDSSAFLRPSAERNQLSLF